jgi:hypothetical protein
MDTSGLIVHVEWPPGTPFEKIMNEVREWLDSENVQPIETKLLTTTKGNGFEIRFENETDVRLFSQQFSLRVVLSGGKSNYVQ